MIKEEMAMNKVVCILLSLFVFIGCANNRQNIWYNYDRQLSNQQTYNIHAAGCKEYSRRATMNMPTSVNPSGYDINYNQAGSFGYGSITPRKTLGDSLSEIGMML